MATLERMRIGQDEHPAVTGDRPLLRVTVEDDGYERRDARRHDFERMEIIVERWDGSRRMGRPWGRLLDLSANGIRIRTVNPQLHADQQVRVRIELPDFAGICPFVDRGQGSLRPTREWIGWLSVTRVQPVEGQIVDIAGRLVEMDDMDRGMLGLYLSTQPLAA